MNRDVVIRAEGLGKRYIIGHQAERESYTALRDVIADKAKSLGRGIGGLLRQGSKVETSKAEEFWALRNINFEINRGDVVGIIGRNGAGKSTLLKILSRITEPTEGRVKIKGRVASLLEVGTGFHAELTGRENIFLNGAILGMTRAEIKRKFDEIVAFADVEKFLDTPVKRYSSGMYVRLAFAVAAHLEPEILIVDEVLAVGDAEFQKKCLGKMGEVAGRGRTVLFVSHNMGALLATCTSGILLDRGGVGARGTMPELAKKYRAGFDGSATLGVRAFEGPLRSLTLEKIILNDAPMLAYATVRPQQKLEFEICGKIEQGFSDFQFMFSLFLDNIRVLSIHHGPKPISPGAFNLALTIPAEFLRPGVYALAFGGRKLSSGEWTWGQNLAEIEIIPEWSDNFHEVDIGLINLPKNASRLRHGLTSALTHTGGST